MSCSDKFGVCSDVDVVFFFFFVLIGVNCIDFLFVFKLSCFFLNFLGGTSLLNVHTCLIYVSFCGNI